MSINYKIIFTILFFSIASYSAAPLEYQAEKYSLVSFYSGEYQNFIGASSYFGLYGHRILQTAKESPNYLSIGLKAGKVDEALDKIAWFVKREISLTNNFSFTLKYNHTIYKIYELGENTFSGILNFQGFFNPTNLFYTSIGMYYRAPAYGKYAVPLNMHGAGSEIFFLASMGYKHFFESDYAFSIDINNYNDFHVFNFNNVGFEFSFSSFFAEAWYYIANVEIRTSGLLVGTGMINEERFMFGIGCNFL